MQDLIIQSIGASSTAYDVIITFPTTYLVGTTFSLEDDDGAEIISFTSQKSFNSVTFSLSSLQKDSTYTIRINGSAYQNFTISSPVTRIDTGNTMNMNPGGGKASGTRPR